VIVVAADFTRTSKFISLILRHDPSAAGITLDSNGWAEIDALLTGLASHGHKISREDLDAIVRDDAKQRYAISDDGRRIRANQGHSIEVELALALEELTPPQFLYHGTATRFADAIRREGLRPMGRHHVHLSADEATAIAVGKRHGKPIVFRIAADEMAAAGTKFFRSANGVWLVDAVPPQYLVDMQSAK
jgi:putative RNA 2'-phosphotransferase